MAALEVAERSEGIPNDMVCVCDSDIVSGGMSVPGWSRVSSLGVSADMCQA